MRLPDDDELYRVDQTYLGPPGRELIPTRYKTIGAFIVICPFVFVVLRRVGVPMTLLTVGLTLLLVIRAAQWFADHATYERPVTSLFVTAWHELSGPRPQKETDTSTAEHYSARVSPRGPLGRWLDRQHEPEQPGDVPPEPIPAAADMEQQ